MNDFQYVIRNEEFFLPPFIGLIYSVSDEGHSCSDTGMAELDTIQECEDAVEHIRNILPDASFYGSIVSSTTTINVKVQYLKMDFKTGVTYLIQYQMSV